MGYPIELTPALEDVRQERQRQDEKWGFPQPAMRSIHHALAVLGEEYGEVCRAACEIDASVSQAGVDVWRKNARKELVQVAAVAVSIVEHIDSGAIFMSPRRTRERISALESVVEEVRRLRGTSQPGLEIYTALDRKLAELSELEDGK